MNIYETIKNIRATCDNYVDPNLLAFIIDDDNHMGKNNIFEINDYNIKDSDTYEERLMKIHKSENIFLPCGMVTFIPILNECDIFSTTDYSLQLTQEEFDEYSDGEEKLFGILIKKESNEYQIGKTDVCNCSVNASFKEFKKVEGEFYKKIKEIIDSKIIY
ncbi:hypothetical protein [Methanobrevibacter sp.]|uniref:hypothetical protein n=1 Tax=Methanobrevibacter sp. TaxID=66852 RepID=UPI003D7CBA7D